jgi:hypothetical protein
LPDAEFRVWCRDQRVFISSVMDEFGEERRVLADRIETFGCEPVLFERFGGREDDPEAAYTHEVASCSLYLGILGRRYGRPLPSRFSATHSEYLTAEQSGLRVAIWAKKVADREGHEQAFLEEVRTFHTTGRFETAGELADDVEGRLRRIAAEDVAPWVKLGVMVFRARRITERAGRIEVLARVRDPAVLARLESMRPDKFGPLDERRLTYSGRVRGCRVEDADVTTTAGSGAEVNLSLVTTDLRADPLSDMSVSEGGTTYSAQDLTEMGLRRALFGETVPIGGLTQHLTEIDNPFRRLAGLSLSEEVIRPVAHLLLTEALVGEGRASRITRFRLGPPVAGRRRLEIAWQVLTRYRGVEPEERHLAGVVNFAA